MMVLLMKVQMKIVLSINIILPSVISDDFSGDNYSHVQRSFDYCANGSCSIHSTDKEDVLCIYIWMFLRNLVHVSIL